MPKLRHISAFLWVTAPSCGYMGNGHPDPGFSCSFAQPDSLQPSLSITNSWSLLTFAGDPGSIPWLERSPGEGNGYSFQYSGLENSMGSRVHGVAELDTTKRLSLS